MVVACATWHFTQSRVFTLQLGLDLYLVTVGIVGSVSLTSLNPLGQSEATTGIGSHPLDTTPRDTRRSRVFRLFTRRALSFLTHVHQHWSYGLECVHCKFRVRSLNEEFISLSLSLSLSLTLTLRPFARATARATLNSNG